MKIIFAILLLPIMSLAAPSPIDGVWKLTSRICSDGRVPSDEGSFQNSTYIAEFSESNFKFYGDYNQCEFHADGFFKLEGKILTLFYVNNSNCRGSSPRGVFKGAIFIQNQEFSVITSAASAGFVCGQNETLISTYTPIKP